MDNLSQIKKLYLSSDLVALYAYLRFWEDNRCRRIEKFLPRKGVIIDFGCGYGIFSNYLALSAPKRKILGFELNKEKVAIAKKAAKKGKISNITFISKDITQAVIPRADTIIIMHVLHHLRNFQEQESILEACVNKVKRNGILLIDEVDKKFSFRYLLGLLADHLLYPGDTFYYRSREEMLSLLKSFPVKVRTKNVSDFLTPFAEIVYLCRKK